MNKIKQLFNKKNKAMLASYARSCLGAVLALVLAGITDPQTLLKAGIAALAPVIIRWVNPNDVAYGRGSASE